VLGFTLPLFALIACQVGLHGCLTGMRMAVPLQALQQGRAPWAIGVMMALFALAPALLSLPAGRMADRYGYHRPATIAACLSLAGALLAAGSQNFGVLCAAAAACGAGASFGMIAVQRTAGRMARNAAERLSIFSWIAIAPAIAGLVGPLTAGALIDRAGFSAAFLTLALLPLATLALTRMVPHEARRPPAAAGGARPAWELMGTPSLRRLLFINWLVAASWDVHSFALPILGHERGLSAGAIGGVLAAYAVASTGVRLLIPVIAHRLSPRLMIIGALLLSAAMFAVYPWLGNAWAMAACTAVFGLALGAVQPAIMSTLHQVAPPERHGEALALRTMTVHMSAATMPLLFGALGTALGVAALFWLMAAALGTGGWQARRIDFHRTG
jgi:MFS family permease